MIGLEIDIDDYYELFEAICNKRWEDLAASVFDEVPDFIVKMFGEFLNNPLCVVITSILLTVAGFIVMRCIISAIRSRG